MTSLSKVCLNGGSRPFANTAVDFAGPFLTKHGRGKVHTKRYICLFTCLHTRAVHLEMAVTLYTDRFLNSFSRMVSRRGWPDVIISDNGTNFVSAHRELKELIQRLDEVQIKRHSANKIKWIWNPPAAPHFGGVFKIKSAKQAVHAILGNADVTYDELNSV